MKNQWEGQYLEEAIAEEAELASVHPKWRAQVKAPRRSGSLISAGAARLTFSATPPARPPLLQWRRDWSAAGPLSTELGLSVRHDTDEGTVSVGVGSGRRNVTESYADHPDVNAATMAAIVRAAIQVLTSERE